MRRLAVAGLALVAAALVALVAVPSPGGRGSSAEPTRVDAPARRAPAEPATLAPPSSPTTTVVSSATGPGPEAELTPVASSPPGVTGPHRVAGSVRLASGARVPSGAYVEATVVGVEHPWIAPVDGDGTYALAGLPAGALSLVAHARGTNPAAQAASRTLPDGPAVALTVDFTFRAGTPCHGRVLDEAGRPVPGASVEAQVRELFEPLATVTDAAGEFRFEPLPGEAASFVASGPAHASTGPHEVVYADGRELDLELRVVSAGALSGTVLDPWGHGLATVRVEAEAASGSIAGVTRTDAVGRFRFDALARGAYRCRAVCAGFADGRSAPVEVTPGAEARAGEVRVREGAVVSGRVFDPAGRGVEGARVEVAGGRHVVSGADGAFEVRGLDEGRLVLRARGEGFLPSTEVALDVPAAAVVLRLQVRASLEGVVLDAAGHGLAGAWVAPLARFDDATRTGSDGAFRLPAGDDGDAWLLVHAPGHLAARVAVVLGAPTRVVLEAAPVAGPASPVRLTLRRDGRPAAGLVVLVAPRGGGDPDLLVVRTSDAAGCAGLPDRPVDLAVVDPGAGHARMWARQVEPAAGGVVWDLEAE